MFMFDLGYALASQTGRFTNIYLEAVHGEYDIISRSYWQVGQNLAIGFPSFGFSFVDLSTINYCRQSIQQTTEILFYSFYRNL